MNLSPCFLSKFLLLLLCALYSTNIEAQEENFKEKLLLGARSEARLQLIEAIKEITITSNTKLRDYAFNNSAFDKKLQDIVKKADEISEPVYQENKICRITLAIPFSVVLKELKAFYEEVPEQKDFLREHLSKLEEASSQRIFYATGVAQEEPTIEKPVQNKKKSSFWTRVTSQGKLMALRAAKVDAYRNLSETIKGIQVTSKTKVENFVTQSDQIQAAFDKFIFGMEITGSPVYKEEGVVEVTVQVAPQKVIDLLMQWRETQEDQKQFKDLSSKLGTIEVKGTGVPPQQYIKEEKEASSDSSSHTNEWPSWATQRLNVTGIAASENKNSLESFDHLKAKAKEDAYQKILRQIRELPWGESTLDKLFEKRGLSSSKMFVLLESLVEVHAREVSSGVVIVEMEIPLARLWKVLKE